MHTTWTRPPTLQITRASVLSTLNDLLRSHQWVQDAFWQTDIAAALPKYTAA